MRCRLPSGSWRNDDTVCVSITREKSFLNFTNFNTSDTSVNYDYTVVPKLSIEYDLPSCLDGTEYLQICMRVSPDDRVAKGFGTSICLANIVGITNIESVLNALNGADLRTWLLGKSVNILEQNYYDGTVINTVGTKTIVNTAPTAAQIHIDKLACGHFEFIAKIVTPCVTVADTLLIELPRIRYEGLLQSVWLASGADTYRSDPYGVPPYTFPTVFADLNPTILDLYCYHSGTPGHDQRHLQRLRINGVQYTNEATDYYNLGDIKTTITAAGIPNYIGLFLDLHYGGTFEGGQRNLNGELILAVQLCGADHTNWGYTNNQYPKPNTNVPFSTSVSTNSRYNYSRLAWRNVLISFGLPYISSHTL